MYIILSSLGLGLFYLLYLVLFKSDTNFRSLRLYLLFAMVLSLLLPLYSGNVLGIFPMQMQQVETFNQWLVQPDNLLINKQHGITDTSGITLKSIILTVYITGLVVFLFRILLQLFQLLKLYKDSDKQKSQGLELVFNSKFQHTFSFFRWVFIGSNQLPEEDLKQIISHEKIHVSQHHSTDVLFIELLAAVMWFNPVVWFMRKTIYLVHEYLADEGALSTGIDKLQYQALLINQIAEERLICLSSSFNHSSIKKRMIMMTKRKFNPYTKVKFLALIPVSLVLLVLVSCTNDVVTDSNLSSKLNLPDADNVVYVLDGNVVADVSDISADSIATVNVVKSENRIEVFTKAYARKNGQVSVRKIELTDAKKLFIIDGVEQSNDDALKNLDPETIESINVIKDKDSMKDYTSDDYDAVLIVTTKSK